MASTTLVKNAWYLHDRSGMHDPTNRGSGPHSISRSLKGETMFSADPDPRLVCHKVPYLSRAYSSRAAKNNGMLL